MSVQNMAARVTGVASAGDNIRESVAGAAASADQMAQSAENLAKLASDMEAMLNSFSLSSAGTGQASNQKTYKKTAGMLPA
jgi:methyl-accepting chemotaxis protein